MPNTFSIGLVEGTPAFPLLWQKSLVYLEKALSYTNAELSLKDVLDRLIAHTMQLWLVTTEQQEIVGASITEVLDYPQTSRLRIVLLGGKDMLAWQEELCNKLVAYARHLGLKELEAYGRPGLFLNLKKLFFKPVYVAYLRSVEASENVSLPAFEQIEKEFKNGQVKRNN